MENYRFTTFKDASIFYRVYGSGRAVVLIHGFGEDGNIWDLLADQLKDNFLVIVPDLPGSGKSNLLKDRDRPVCIDDYAEAVIQVLQTESLSRCIVIGHSMGGYITLAIAEKYGELLNGFCLFNSTAFADNDEKKTNRLKSMDFLQSNEAALFLKTSIPVLFADKFKREHHYEVEKLINSVEYFTREALIQYSRAMLNRPERINVLQITTLPVLFIIGEDDAAVPLEKSLAQCHLPAVSYVHILAGVGHMGMMEDKTFCTEIILAYLDSINAASYNE